MKINKHNIKQDNEVIANRISFKLNQTYLTCLDYIIELKHTNQNSVCYADIYNVCKKQLNRYYNEINFSQSLVTSEVIENHFELWDTLAEPLNLADESLKIKTKHRW